MAANMQGIEQQLKEFTEVHGTVLLGMHRELQSHLQIVDDKLGSSTRELHEFSTQLLDDLKSRSIAIDEATVKINGHITAVNDKFSSSLIKYKEQIESSENSITAYMRTQQELLDTQACEMKNKTRDIESINQTVRNMLSELDRKTRDHELREAAFNKRFRIISLLGIAIGGILLIGTIILTMGVWKIWPH